MQLPIDPKALRSAVSDGDRAREADIAVSVLLDPTAPADLVAFVRSLFASDRPNARITIDYLDDYRIHPSDDMAVIVAGVSDDAGRAAAQLRGAGVPALIATTLPVCAEDIARAAGCPIPEGDIAAPPNPKLPCERTASSVARTVAADVAGAVRDGAQALAQFAPVLEGVARGAASVAGAARAPRELGASERVAAAEARVTAAQAEPIVLDDEAKRAFSERMGAWVVAACHEKRLAFALAFPFVRRPLAADAIAATSCQNAAVGLVPLVPGADLPLMTLNQAKMAVQIAAAYGQPLDRKRAPELAALVVNAFGCRALARKAIALVPGIGWVVRPAVGYTGTQAMGCALVEYFEGGGNLTGLANVVEKAAGAAAKTVEAGKAAYDKAKGTVASE